MKAAGLNFADLVFLAGRYQSQPALPFVPGLEATGEIVACGEGVTGFAVGDRVIGQLPCGGFAEYAAMPAATAVRLNVQMPDAEAAAFYVNYGTAYSALVQRAGARTGERVLILGAAGGVGLAALQIAKALGMVVIADCRGEGKRALARGQGADAVVDHSASDFAEAIGVATGGHGCDVVLDMIGGEATAQALRTIAWCGRLVLIGFAGGRPHAIPANHLLVKNCVAIGHWWGDYSARDRGSLDAAFEALFDLYREGRIAAFVSTVLTLDQVPDGLRRYADRDVLSKIVALP